MATNRTRQKRGRGAHMGLDPLVLAFIQGEPVPKGVKAVTEEQRDLMTEAYYFHDFILRGQRVAVSVFPGAVRSWRDMDRAFLDLPVTGL